jgi:hypothetical protein
VAGVIWRPAHQTARILRVAVMSVVASVPETGRCPQDPRTFVPLLDKFVDLVGGYFEDVDEGDSVVGHTSAYPFVDLSRANQRSAGSGEALPRPRRVDRRPQPGQCQ